MIILGIETSCDETAAAVIKDGTKILSNVVATSAEMHTKTGGIIPEQAARQQVKAIIPVMSEAISEALAIKPSNHASGGQMVKWLNGQIVKNLDAIAVTVGPGLIGSLLVGVETAKTLACLWNKPIVPVNHLAAHIYANFIRKIPNSKFQIPNKSPELPALCLVVSGGHTDLVLMKKHGKLKWIGGTRDDAAGEAFDKTARLLGLPYPGGPAISAEAEKYLTTRNSQLTLLPRPMIKEDNYDWSFSGLKTSVMRRVKEQESKRVKEKLSISQLSAEIQEAIVDVLVAKTLRAAKKYKPKSTLLAGGVAANNRLREKFQKQINELTNQRINFFVPPPNLCTDNAAYIASYAYFNYNPVDWKKINANPGLTIVGEV